MFLLCTYYYLHSAPRALSIQTSNCVSTQCNELGLSNSMQCFMWCLLLSSSPTDSFFCSFMTQFYEDINKLHRIGIIKNTKHNSIQSSSNNNFDGASKLHVSQQVWYWSKPKSKSIYSVNSEIIFILNSLYYTAHIK